jgi:hypothetical protein
MNVKAYFRAVVKEDGQGFIKDCRQIIGNLGFTPNEIVIAPEKLRYRQFQDAIDWLAQNYPETRYRDANDGLDWFFEDPQVALMFKLRWC